MATERLNILAGAAALREFTAPELAAFTGANPSTVRHVLRREQCRRTILDHVEDRARAGGRRGAVLWRVADEAAEAILDEIAGEESQTRTQSDGSLGLADASDPADRSELYLLSAEDAVNRSYEAADSAGRATLARMAINLVSAANPNASKESLSSSSRRWWEEEPGSSGQPARPDVTPLRIVSRAHIGNQVHGAAPSPQESDYSQLRARARRVMAFARLSVRQADGLRIGLEDLAGAAEAISESSDILPIQHTLNWVKIFISVSEESGSLPPVAILTKSDPSDQEMFPVGHSWHRLAPPAELADTGYALWVEPWAETLLTSNLIPGVIVSHDDTLQSEAALRTVIAPTSGDTGEADPAATRAVIVASTTDDFDKVYKQVFLEGGILFPARKSFDDLSNFVWWAVRRVFSGLPETPRPSAATVVDVNYRLAAVSEIAYSQEIISAVNSIQIHSSDLDIAEHALEALSALQSAANASPILPGRDFISAARTFAQIVSRLPNASHSIAAVEAAINVYRRIIDLRSKPSYLLYQSDMLHNPYAERWRSQVLKELSSTHKAPESAGAGGALSGTDSHVDGAK